MKHTSRAVAVEIREAASGRQLHAVILQEGRAASERRELFAPGAVLWPSDGIGIQLQHYGPHVAKAFPVRDSEGRISVRVQATRELRDAVEAGRKFMSVEFYALAERQTKGGIREITRALVESAALVTEPEYTQTEAEIRARAAERGPAAIPCERLGRLLPWL